MQRLWRVIAPPLLGPSLAAGPDPLARVRTTSGSRPGFSLEWEHRGFGTNSKLPFFVGDVDRDGSDEIVSAAVDWWSITTLSGGQASKVWESPLYEFPISGFAVGQADSDPALEVVLAVEYELLIYDGQTHVLEHAIAVAEREPLRMVVADLNQDGSPEIAYCSRYISRIVNVAREATSFTSTGCFDLAVGNVDPDPVPELILAGGTDFPNGKYGPSVVIDGATRVVEWTSPVSFGNRTTLLDEDGDGISRIVGTQGFGTTHLFDASPQQVVATHEPRYSIDAIRALDVDGDDPWGDIVSLAPLSQNVL